MKTIGQLTVEHPERAPWLCMQYLDSDRRPIGVIVNGHQPQRGIPCIAGQRGWDVVSLLRVRLGTETGSRPAVWSAWIDIKGHENWRHWNVVSCRRQRRLIEAEVFRDLTLIPGAMQLGVFAL